MSDYQTDVPHFEGFNVAADPTHRSRTRACESCRRMKSQCVFAPLDNSTCERCVRAKRVCVPSVWKSRSRPSTHISVLERKIQGLVDDLNELRATRVPHNQQSHARDPGLPAVSRSNSTINTTSSSQPSTGDSSVVSLANSIQLEQRRPLLGPDAPQDNWPEVVQSGDLSVELACAGFDHFFKHMLVHFPILVFPAETIASKIQQDRPILFLAILNAASGLYPIPIQHRIHQELFASFARLILVDGEKSLEIVQALQVSSLWYYAPPRYKDLKYYQLIHCAAIMAIDIGISRKKSLRVRSNVGMAESSSKDHGRRLTCPEPNSAEARRAWLGCYFLCAQTAQNLRRENLIRWSPYLADCLSILEASSGETLSDRLLCQWIRYQRIGDEIGSQFSIEDPTASRTIDDVGLQFTIQSFERQINESGGGLQVDVHPGKLPLIIETPLQSSGGTDDCIVTLELGQALVRIFLHEVALHSGSSDHDMQPPFVEESLAQLKPTNEFVMSPIYVKSLSTCLSNIHRLLDTFLRLTLEDVRCQPTFQFVRLVYAVVVLVKISVGSTVSEEIFCEDKKESREQTIHRYLSSLMEKLHSAADGGRCASAAKFGLVLLSIKRCFQRMLKEAAHSTTAPTGFALANLGAGSVRPTSAPSNLSERRHSDIAFAQTTSISPGPFQMAPRLPLGQNSASPVDLWATDLGGNMGGGYFQTGGDMNMTDEEMNWMYSQYDVSGFDWSQ